MRIGALKEIKTLEFRIGLVPGIVQRLVGKGHEVLVEAGAGVGVGIFDADYAAAGVCIASDADEVFGRADLIVKVKGPQPGEIKRLVRNGEWIHPAVIQAFRHGPGRGTTLNRRPEWDSEATANL